MFKIKLFWLKRLSINYAFFLHETSSTVKVDKPTPAYNLAELVKLGCTISIKCENLDKVTIDEVRVCYIQIPYLKNGEIKGFKNMKFSLFDPILTSQNMDNDYVCYSKHVSKDDYWEDFSINTHKGIAKHLLGLYAFINKHTIYSN